MLTEKGDLTGIGSWYLGGSATNNIPHNSLAGGLKSENSVMAAVLVVLVGFFAL
jgi:hypothetical protein